MKNTITAFAFILYFSCLSLYGQTGNHVFETAEIATFGELDLATPGSQTWSTARSASPGFFSAIGVASFNSASDAHNVNGYVKHYSNALNQPFVFPIGTGLDLRTLSISGSRANNSIIATAWILGDPSIGTDPTAPAAGAHDVSSVGAGIVAVSPIGQWDWMDLSNNAAGLTVTVSIPDHTHFAIASDLRLVGWDGTSWVNLSGSSGASGNSENSTLSGIMIAGISALGIGSATTPLPITLVDFNGKCINQVVILNWITSMELNHDRFDVEASENGLDWSRIGGVKSDGNSNRTKSYAFNVELKTTFFQYFRLKSVDLNGQFDYSKIVKVNCETNTNSLKLNVLPNPTKDYVKIESNAPIELYELRSVDGKVLQWGFAPLSFYELDLSKYQAGVYFFSTRTAVVKLVKYN